MNKISIIIPALGSKGWTGGQIYQENLIEALRYKKDTSIYILNDLSQTTELTNNEGIKPKLLKLISQIYLSVNFQLSRFILGYDRRLSRMFRQFCKSETNVLFTDNHSYLDIKGNIIKLYWIPDFQHIHLPNLFTTEQIKERNYKFIKGCQKSDVIILSSKNAQNDLLKFAPQYINKSRISHFVANVNDSVWEQDPAWLTEKYSIPEKFFYIPNQFWKHKNHLVVFEALFHLKQKGILLNVVCTGNPAEFRNPEHYNEIRKMISDWKITDQIHLLGLVPHDHVLLLIRQSIALINPSLFEGWSTTVEECKSIGKKALLSDIPVHREQAPYKVKYFDPGDAHKLAEVLSKTWNESTPGPDLEQEKDSRQRMVKRIEAYADNFINIIKSFQNSNSEIKKAKFNTPILFLIFNRPEHTFKVFEMIRKMRPSQLFIAADGPREDVPTDKLRCKAARDIIHLIDWECDLKLLFRDKNLSTKTAVSSAINWFFDHVEEGIILEDDCLADESFFYYCKELLERYRENDKIMHINGSNFLLGKKFNFDASYYFSNLCHPWGWATWRRAWLKYDIEMKNLADFLKENKISRITTNEKAAMHYTKSLVETASGKINTWDYQWFYTIWKNEGIVITPVKNLISNIGFGKDATHTNYKYTRLSEMKRNKIITVTHPKEIKINKKADEAAFLVSINEGKGNLLEQLIAKIKLTLGAK